MAGSTGGRPSCRISRSLLIAALVVSSCFFNSGAVDNAINEEIAMGINYGIIADNLPSITEAVALISSMKIGKVRIYDANPAVLNALANTGISATISVTTDLIGGIAADPSVADAWIANNVVAYQNTLVRYVIVGNELFSYPALNVTWYQVLPAMQNLHESLVSRGLSDTVKITTCLAMDILASSYPPSTGAFREDIAVPLMQPILQFISKTNSYFFINVYPYFAWASNSQSMSIEYALFGTGSLAVTVTDGQYTYTSLLDAQVDAVIAAMNAVGYGETNIAIGETGWPTLGDPSQPGANPAYAAMYNRRLVRKAMTNPAVGTPRRPGQFVPTYIFALFNEDLKPGPSTERNWGLLFPNTSQVYPIDMTGQLPDSAYPPMATPSQAPTTSVPSNGAASPAQSTPFVTSGTWCVANTAAHPDSTQAGMDWACSTGGADCIPIQAGGVCYDPNTIYDHGSFVFNSYFQQFKTKGGTCDFSGAALLTTVNPSPANNTACVYTYTP